MDYIVKLQNFEGPLDLLLDLIKQKELDIFNIPISEITSDYMEKLKMMEENQIEITSDFIEMASTLLFIKTKMMIPSEKEDAREELVQQLLEYKEYKKAAERLKEMKEIEEKYFKRQKQDKVTKQRRGTIKDIMNIYQQVLSFKKILKPKKNKLDELNRETLRFRFSIEGQMEYLKEQITENKINVYELFMKMDDKEEIVETFGAILELSKVQYINITTENDNFYIERKV